MKHVATITIACTLFCRPAIAESQQWYGIGSTGCIPWPYSPARVYENNEKYGDVKIIEVDNNRVDVVSKRQLMHFVFYRTVESCAAAFNVQKGAAEQQQQQREKELEKYR